MPGVERLSIEALVDAAGEAAELGVPAIAIFPVVPPALKGEDGDEACRPDNLCNRAIRAVKQAVPEHRRHLRRRARSLYDPWP